MQRYSVQKDADYSGDTSSRHSHAILTLERCWPRCRLASVKMSNAMDMDVPPQRPEPRRNTSDPMIDGQQGPGSRPARVATGITPHQNAVCIMRMSFGD